MLYIKAGAACMAGAWFILWPVWPVRLVYGLYWPVKYDYVANLIEIYWTELRTQVVWHLSLCYYYSWLPVNSSHSEVITRRTRRSELVTNVATDTVNSSPGKHNMANFGLLTVDIGSGVCMMFGRLLGCYIIYTLSGALAPWGNFAMCKIQNFATCKIHFVSQSCVLLYWQCYCAALRQWGQPNYAACSSIFKFRWTISSTKVTLKFEDT